MLNLDIHKVKSVKIEIKYFGDFNTMSLRIDDGVQVTRISLFCDKNVNLPMDLLNQLGPAIEGAVIC